MIAAMTFDAGGYRFLPAVFQYSAGVAALPGFGIERVRLQRGTTLSEGFDAIAAQLARRGRPLTALCGCELRSPAPFSETGFVEFNRHYVQTLERWGLVTGAVNPVARTNVCPVFAPPAQPLLHAFSYTVPAAASGAPAAATDFVVAGGGEAPEGHANYRDVIVRLGDLSADGLRDKLRYVVREMERRLQALGLVWADAAATQAYTVHDIGALVGPEIVQRGAAAGGLNWHFARPPIVDLEYEMDVRRVTSELLLS